LWTRDGSRGEGDKVVDRATRATAAALELPWVCRRLDRLIHAALG